LALGFPPSPVLLSGHHGFAGQAVAALNVVRSTASFFSAARYSEAPIDEGAAPKLRLLNPV